MCLQTYLYYYCKTLLYAIEHKKPVQSLKYGVCCVTSLCERWKNFFTPAFLMGAKSDTSPSVALSLWKLESMQLVISTLLSRCNAAIQASKGDCPFTVDYEFSLLECTLRKFVLPELKEWGYATEEGVEVMYFDATDSYLISFAPVAGTNCFDGVPGLYTRDERRIAAHYFSLVRKAPTICYLSGVEIEGEPSVRAIDISLFRDRTSKMCGLAQFNPAVENEDSLCESVYQQWL